VLRGRKKKKFAEEYRNKRERNGRTRGKLRVPLRIHGDGGRQKSRRRGKVAKPARNCVEQGDIQKRISTAAFVIDAVQAGRWEKEKTGGKKS